jgi:hypothetical protein
MRAGRRAQPAATAQKENTVGLMRSERAQRFDRLTAGKTAPLQSFQRLERERYGFSRHWKISRDFFRGLEKAAACPQGLMVTTKVGKSALTGALPTAQGRICVVGSATTEEKNSSLDPRPSPLAPRPSTLAPRHPSLQDCWHRERKLQAARRWIRLCGGR